MSKVTNNFRPVLIRYKSGETGEATTGSRNLKLKPVNNFGAGVHVKLSLSPD